MLWGCCPSQISIEGHLAFGAPLEWRWSGMPILGHILLAMSQAAWCVGDPRGTHMNTHPLQHNHSNSCHWENSGHGLRAHHHQIFQ